MGVRCGQGWARRTRRAAPRAGRGQLQRRRAAGEAAAADVPAAAAAAAAVRQQRRRGVLGSDGGSAAAPRLDGGAGGGVVHQHHAVEQLAAHAEGLGAHVLDRHAVCGAEQVARWLATTRRGLQASNSGRAGSTAALPRRPPRAQQRPAPAAAPTRKGVDLGERHALAARQALRHRVGACGRRAGGSHDGQRERAGRLGRAAGARCGPALRPARSPSASTALAEHAPTSAWHPPAHPPTHPTTHPWAPRR